MTFSSLDFDTRAILLEIVVIDIYTPPIITSVTRTVVALTIEFVLRLSNLLGITTLQVTWITTIAGQVFRVCP